MSPIEVSSDARLRLALLLTILSGLAYYAATHWPWGGDGGETMAAVSPACAAAEAPPPLADASSGEIAKLRADLAERVAHSDQPDVYEEGLADARVAWSDGYPSDKLNWDPDGTMPAGYEIRWWSPVANHALDVWVFADDADARAYFRSAAGGDCRPQASARWTPQPAGGRNLVWLNPEGVMQEDLFLRRGRRVYRLALVRKLAGARMTAAARRDNIARLNRLGCALFGCATESVALS